MTTREVVDHHLEAVRANDIEDTLADYAEDAVIVAAGTTITGRPAIREAMLGAFEAFFKPGTYVWTIESHVVAGTYSVVTWSLEFPGGTIPWGMDAFHVVDERIVFQTGGFYLAAS